MDVHRGISRARDFHLASFGQVAKICVAAPGRVNLIGEHTDYNDGFVLPFAIDRHVFVAASICSDVRRNLTICSESQADPVDISLSGRPLPAEPLWANYVRGVVAGFVDRGFSLPGCKLSISADLPIGSGLSSSAALEVAIATTFETLLEVRLDPLDKARLCQAAEHEFAGVPCGLMDQLASVFGRAEYAMFIDCRTQEVRHVRLPEKDVCILVCNSNVRHSMADGEYAKRRIQCLEAARFLGKASLRDVTEQDLSEAVSGMNDMLLKRARHVVSENLRASAFAATLTSNDLSRAGELMYASHASLRDDYQVSCIELDHLVASAQNLGETQGVYGSRMTGGGFGGCSVSLVRTSCVEAIVESMTATYRSATGRTLEAFVAWPSEAAIWRE